MLKKSEKSCTVRLHVLCACIKFYGKITFFVTCAKKTKKYVIERYLEALKFVFFAETKQKDIFQKTLCRVHTFANLYAWYFLLNFFDILKRAQNAFFDQWMHMPMGSGGALSVDIQLLRSQRWLLPSTIFPNFSNVTSMVCCYGLYDKRNVVLRLDILPFSCFPTFPPNISSSNCNSFL